jgi:flagellar hook-associated protein 1 FlgK
LGTLFSALDVARSGLTASQVQLDTTAHNIANVNREGYSRQRAELLTRLPVTFQFGQIGRGVQIDNIVRIRDPFLDQAFRNQVPGLGSSDLTAEYYRLIDGIFLEPGENGFGTRLGQFFDALNDFASNVESFPVREALVAETRQIALSFNDIAQRFTTLRTNANEEVRTMVPRINSLAERLTDLNQQIVRAEANLTSANDLRDERDRLLDELAHMVNISVVEENKQVSVFIGNDALVEGVLWNEIEAVRNPALDPERQDLLEVRFVGSGIPVDIRDGELFGALSVRDTILPAFDDRLDDIAHALIGAINGIQAQANGVDNLSGTLSSTNDVSDPADPLVGGALPFDVVAGSFDVVVYDAAGNPTSTTITITGATTLNSLAADLNAVGNFSASVVGNRIELGTTAPFTFGFANDSSGAIAALGINGLFTGDDATSIRINPDIEANPNLISSGYSLDPLATGDNTAALDMAALRNALLLDSGSSTLTGFYEATIARLGVESRANQERLDVQQTFVDDFERRRQEVSGVSLDEEVTLLIQYQRAFEGSARVITVTDRMLGTLLAMAT